MSPYGIINFCASFGRWLPITSLIGNHNGTSSDILSQISPYDAQFDEAQQKGYAEADPALNVNRENAAQKHTLFSSLTSGGPVNFATVDIGAPARLGTGCR
ncbi:MULTISPECIES: hypothetical protein [Pseudomonas]|uniref:Homoserine dehydrogenase catalytic domain-containing protein n=1 Tax=Pseudomonas lini TaxID=163011 RepID=A0A7V7P706_9PSED|nr:hypothetical protein F7R14_04620 [Pseudomonas lini]MDT9673146.1 hypothetical protein [Pseudomonas sp. JV414]NSX07340.1 hypothetical protein [Pseudomonas lini]